MAGDEFESFCLVIQVLKTFICVGVSKCHTNTFFPDFCFNNFYFLFFFRVKVNPAYAQYKDLCGNGYPIFWLFPFGSRRAAQKYINTV